MAEEASGKEKVAKAFLGQAIVEFTRPVIEKLVGNIPIEVLKSAKKMGLDKILPALSIAFSSVFPKGKIPLGEEIEDFVTEGTAELRKAINERLEGKSTSSDSTEKEETSASGNVVKQKKQKKATVADLILSPELSDDLTKIINAYTDLLKDKDGNEIDEKNRKVIDSFLEQMDAKSLYSFLSLPKKQRRNIITLFTKKVNGGEAVKDITEEKINKAYLKKIDKIFKPGSAIDIKISDFEKYTNKLRKKAEKFRRSQQKGGA